MAFRLLQTGTDRRLQEDGSSFRLLEAGPTTGLRMERVLQVPASFPAAGNNCYFHDTYACCLQTRRYRWLNWEGRKASALDATLAESQAQLYGSTDEGATWSLLTTLTLPVEIQWSAIYSPGGDVLLAAGHDSAAGAYDSAYSLIARSADAGLTWTSAVTSGTFSTVNFATITQGFFQLPGTETIFAYGSYPDIDGSAYNFLRSTDNGVTFVPYASTGDFLIQYATALSTEALVCSNGVTPYYSTDSGASWLPGTKPAGCAIGDAMMLRGDGAVLTIGRDAASLAAAFLSTDNGLTYTQSGSLVGGENSSAATVIGYTTDVLVAGCNTTADDLQAWWVSPDGGAAWGLAEHLSDREAACDVLSITITADGYLLAGLDRPTRATVASDNYGEIWRGTLSAVPTGYATPCSALADDDDDEDGEGPEVPSTDAVTPGRASRCLGAFATAACRQMC